MGRPTKVASTADRVGLSTLAMPDPSALKAYKGQSAACPPARVESQTQAANRQRELGAKQQEATVDGIGDRTAEQ